MPHEEQIMLSDVVSPTLPEPAMNFTLNTAQLVLDLKNGADNEGIVKHGTQTIYGTGTAQKVYLRVQEFFALHTKPKDWTAKNLLQHVETKHIVKENYQAISNFWLSVKGQYIQGAVPGSPDTDEKARFWGDFDSAYAKLGTDPKALPAVVKGPEIRAPNAVGFNPRAADILVDDIIVRRSCKFLLYDSIGRDQDIAYVLDDLDLNTVAQRLRVEETTDKLGPNTTERKVPVCTSELREIFRRWDFFVRHLTFYTNFVTCLEPWSTTGQQHWATYANHLAGKILVNHPGAAVARAGVAQALNAGMYVQAIERFHEMKPSRYLPSAFTNIISSY
jgi:hypothetical protein